MLYPSSGMRLIYWGSIFLLFSALASAADVYRWVDDKGVVHYSDKQTKSATKVELRPLQEIETLPVSGASANKTSDPAPGNAASADFSFYQGLQITRPSPDDTLRSNEGTVAVSFDLTPAVRTAIGHQAIIYLDGAQAIKINGGGATLQAVSPGEHVLSVSVVDASGKELIRSPSVRFFLLRALPENPPTTSGGPNTPPTNQQSPKVPTPFQAPRAR